MITSEWHIVLGDNMYYVYIKSIIVYKGNYYECLEFIENNSMNGYPTRRIIWEYYYQWFR